MCTDNITDVSIKDEQSDDAPHFVNSVDGFICQSTIIPADGRGFRTAISSQSVSLADTFIGATFSQTLVLPSSCQIPQLTLNLCAQTGATVEAELDGVEAEPDLFPASSIDLPDINFFYRYNSLRK